MSRLLKTRVLSMILVVVMVIGLVPMNVFATEVESATTETVIVKFDVNGGIGEYEDQEVILGEKITRPEEDPIREYATFAYWTADLEENEEWNFEEAVVSEDITLYATWIVPGAQNEEPEHVHTGGIATCKELAVCECGEAYGELAGHTPSEDGAVCTVCEAVLIEEETEHVHIGGTATCTEQAICECGEPYGELADHIPAEDDGDCTTELVCVVCGEVVAEAAENHTPDEDGLVCVICGAELPMILVDPAEDFGDGYYSVISEKNWDIAPGIKETELVLNNADNNHRQVLHIMEADMNNPYTKVTTSYTNMDTSNYAVSNMLVQANWVRDNWGWNVVGAMNSCLSWYNSAAYAQDPSRVNEPLGFMMIDGEVYFDHSVGFPTVLVIHKDTNEAGEARPADIPKVQMRTVENSGDLNGWEEQVIPTSSGFIVKEGVNQYKPDHAAGAPRSVVGIKPDGTVVIMMNDGRQDPYSIGMTMYELAEVMLSLGCSYAVNCDGGGSSTFLSQRPGTTGLAINCSPSDGALRENTSGVLIISTAPADGAFNNAYISSEYDYYTPNSEIVLDVAGLDFSGAAAEIPEEAVWALSDDSFGTVADGVFTSTGKTGAVDVQMVYNEKIVGSKTLNIVNPEKISFAQADTVIPYGKTISMDIRATYGVFDVGFVADSFDWTLSNENAGVLNGLEFTASDDASIDGVMITAVYKYADLDALVLKVAFGKGSEVMWDFEDGDISNWMGQEQIQEWLAANQIPKSNLFDGGFGKEAGGNYSVDNSTRTFLSSRENGGQVKSGDYALGLEVDYRYSRFSEWSYTVLFNVEGQTVLRDVANGKNATKLGMWVYIPEGLVVGKDLKGLAMQYQFYCASSAEEMEAVLKTAAETNSMIPSANRFGGHLLTANGKNLASLTDADIPEDRWVYFYIDLSNYAYVSLQNPENYFWREPSFIRFYTQHYTPKNLVFYFDDLTLDYSDAVEDRDPPEISNLVIDVEGNNRRTFNATVADFVASNTSGLNYSSAKIYVDGVALTGVSAGGSRISGDAVEIPCGIHTVTFEISDNMGNTSKKSQSFTVAGTAPVTLSGHNDLNNKPEYDSVYYVDINVAEIEKIDSITAVLDLNSAHLWEIAGMTASEGFTASASVNEYANTVTVTVTRTGECALTGNQTLVSIPTRIYSWRDTSVYSAEQAFASGLCPVVPYDAKVVMGSVTFTTGAYDGYAGVFGGSISVVTNLDDNKVAWHSHTVEELEDKAATCIEDGYTGRTYCHECGSVITWGTVSKAQGHKWELNDEGRLACANDPEEMFNGIYEDKEYIDGVVISDGWIEVDGVRVAYYKDGKKLTGSHILDGVMCTFDEEGTYLPKYQYEGFYEVGDTIMYFIANKQITGYYRLNNKPYFFDNNGLGYDGEFVFNGEKCLLDDGTFVSSENADVVEAGWCGETTSYAVYRDGRLEVTGTGKIDNYGLIPSPWSLYVRDITSIFIGKDITRIGNNAFRNCCWVTSITFEEGSNLKAIGYRGIHNLQNLRSVTLPESVESLAEEAFGYAYRLTNVYLGASLSDIHPKAFNKHGSNMVLDVEEGTYAEQYAKDNGMNYTVREHIVKNGIYEIGDVLYYYVNDVRTPAGLIKLDGSYYYASTGGVIKTGKYWVSRPNDLMPAGFYFFDEETGKMIIKNGVYSEDGGLYYYVDDVRTSAGLVKIDGDYYYASTGGVVKTGKYWVSRPNGLMPAGYYFFDEETGKMIIKNGVYSEDGGLYYYEDGARVSAGLVKIDGYYYYASTNGVVKTGKYWVSRPNGLLPEGFYFFDETTGRMNIKNGIYSENGGLYYYVDDVPTRAGLVKIGDDYYYASTGGKLVTGKYWVSRPNDLMPVGFYYFDEVTGKMIP